MDYFNIMTILFINKQIKKMRTLIIFNPYSAKGKGIESKDFIENELKRWKIDYEICITRNLEDLIETTKKNLSKDFNNFISVGGDGTLHYMANILAGTNKNLGIIPMGSGNDISKNLDLPTDIKSCCKVIKKSKIKKIDLGLINNKYYYLCIAGSGFDSEVTDLANNTRFPFKGSSKYTYAVYKTLMTFRSKKFFLSYNGKKREIYGMMIAASNMQSYGGGMRITPNASSQDGLFDICIIKRMSKLHFIKVFPKVYEGKHIEDPFVEIFRTDTMKLDSEHPFSVFADGEYICKLPVTFKIIPKHLNFLAP